MSDAPSDKVLRALLEDVRDGITGWVEATMELRRLFAAPTPPATTRERIVAALKVGICARINASSRSKGAQVKPEDLKSAFYSEEIRHHADAILSALSPPVAGGEVERLRTDTKRLEWLMQSGAHIAFSKDGEDCWLHWAYNPDDEEGESVNQKGKFDSPREAIDAEMTRVAEKKSQ